MQFYIDRGFAGCAPIATRIELRKREIMKAAAAAGETAVHVLTRSWLNLKILNDKVGPKTCIFHPPYRSKSVVLVNGVPRIFSNLEYLARISDIREIGTLHK